MICSDSRRGVSPAKTGSMLAAGLKVGALDGLEPCLSVFDHLFELLRGVRIVDRQQRTAIAGDVLAQFGGVAAPRRRIGLSADQTDAIFCADFL